MLRRWDFWFGLIGVFGVLFALYTYFITNKTGRLSYNFDTQKVFDPANLSGFTLVTPTKESVGRPVYATDIAVWNSGDLSLSDVSDRVREPLKITFDGFIFYHIVARTNFVNPENYHVETSPDKSAITVRWKFMDPGQGIRLTILHSANTVTTPSLAGRFFEASLRRENLPSKPTKSDISFFWLIGTGLSILGCVAIAFALRFIHNPARLRNAHGRPAFARILDSVGRRRVAVAMSCAMVVEGLTILTVAMYFSYAYSSPPV